MVAVTLGVVSAAFLFFFRAIEFSANSIGYAVNVQQGIPGELFYAPHLGHASIVRVFFRILRPIGDCNVICAGQAHSIMWALIGVICMYMLIRRFTRSYPIALLAAVALLVSNGFWVFATQLEVYVPVAGSLLLLAAVLVFARDRWSAGPYVLTCAGIWTLATLYHQANAIFAVPLAVYLVTKFGRRGVRSAVLVCGSAGVAVLLAYIGAHAATDSEQSLLAWMLGLASTDLTDWGTLSNWDFAGLKQALYNQVASLVVLPDEVRPYQIPVQWRGALLILAIIGWNVAYVVRRAPQFEARLFFVAWFCVYFLFFAWWDPRVLKFFIPSGVPLIALGSLALHDMVLAARRVVERRGYPSWVPDATIGTGAGLVLVLVFVFNLVGSMLPIRGNLGPPLGPHHQDARILDELAPEECQVIGLGHQLLYLSYYFDTATQRPKRGIRSLFQSYYDDVLSGTSGGGHAREQISAESPCVLVNLGHLSEQYFSFRTRPAVLVKSPTLRSPEWQEFLNWFFRVEPIEGSKEVTFDAFDIIVYTDHKPYVPYVLVDRRVRQEAPGGYIADVLTAHVEDYGYQGTSVFPGRDRTLIFGYSGNLNSSEPSGLWTTLLDFMKNPERGAPPGRRD